MTAAIAACLGVVGLLVAWYRRRAAKAEARVVVADHRADVATATHQADRAAEASERHGEIVAARDIPTVTADGSPPTVAATNAAWAVSDAQRRAGDRVRAKIARKR